MDSTGGSCLYLMIVTPFVPMKISSQHADTVGCCGTSINFVPVSTAGSLSWRVQVVATKVLQLAVLFVKRRSSRWLQGLQDRHLRRNVSVQGDGQGYQLKMSHQGCWTQGKIKMFHWLIWHVLMWRASVTRSLFANQLGLEITKICWLGKSCSYAAFKHRVCPQNHPLLACKLPECPIHHQHYRITLPGYSLVVWPLLWGFWSRVSATWQSCSQFKRNWSNLRTIQLFSSCMEINLSDLSKDHASASTACSKVCKQQIY